MFSLTIKLFLYRMMQVFPINKKKIIVNNFNGKGYGDNAKYIYEELHHVYGDKFDYYWIVNDRTDELPKFIKAVKRRSLSCIFHVSTSHFILNNVRNFEFIKRKKQIYFQLWHAPYTIKLVEKEVENKLSKQYVRSAKYDGAITDYIISESRLKSEQLKEYFWLSDESIILEIGLPRDDIFFKQDKDTIVRKIKNNLGISSQFVVLYAPTFRDNLNSDAYISDYRRIVTCIKNKFGNDVIILIRMHPNVHNDISAEEQTKNVSDYPDMQELLLISDLLITDYSSTPYEFMLFGRPIFLLIKDFDSYIKERGVNDMFYCLPFDIASNEKELCDYISNYDNSSYVSKLNKFIQGFGMFESGKASKIVGEIIANLYFKEG